MYGSIIAACVSCIKSLLSILFLDDDVAANDGEDILLGITKHESLHVCFDGIFSGIFKKESLTVLRWIPLFLELLVVLVQLMAPHRSNLFDADAAAAAADADADADDDDDDDVDDVDDDDFNVA